MGRLVAGLLVVACACSSEVPAPPDLSVVDGAAALPDLAERPLDLGTTVAPPDALAPPDLAMDATVAAGDAATGVVRFDPPVKYAVGAAPYGIVAARLDGDGLIDLAVADSVGDTVSILAGSGGGAFAVARSYASGGHKPVALAAGDFNEDGASDLAVAYVNQINLISGVRVLRGAGDGSFQAFGAIVAAGIFTHSVVTLDADGDGHLDLADCATAGGTARLGRGLGDGTFQTGSTYNVGSAQQVVSADFNGDGHPDLAVANGAGYTLLLGVGDGTFQPRMGSVAFAAQTLAAADVDGDGRVDLVLGSPSSLLLLPGQGDGTFGTAVSHPTPAHGLAIADLDGDGRPDLVVAEAGGGTVSVVRNLGPWVFQLDGVHASGQHTLGVTVADLDGDGRLDVAATNMYENTVTVLLNRTP